MSRRSAFGRDCLFAKLADSRPWPTGRSRRRSPPRHGRRTGARGPEAVVQDEHSTGIHGLRSGSRLQRNAQRHLRGLTHGLGVIEDQARTCLGQALVRIAIAKGPVSGLRDGHQCQCGRRLFGLIIVAVRTSSNRCLNLQPSIPGARS